jgi:hypothetical protein
LYAFSCSTEREFVRQTPWHTANKSCGSTVGCLAMPRTIGPNKTVVPGVIQHETQDSYCEQHRATESQFPHEYRAVSAALVLQHPVRAATAALSANITSSALQEYPAQ